MSNSITTNKLLLVEGQDEINFFTKLLSYLKIENVTIRSAGGCIGFKKLYPSVVVSTGFSDITRIGFVRDAEQNEAFSAYESICNIVKQFTPEISLPDSPGTIKNNGDFYCGIFIMPNNKDKGMLEDLCLKSVEDKKLYKYADDYVQNAGNLMNENELATYNKHKAKVQTYIAGKSELTNSLGIAAQKGIWDFSNNAFDDLRLFITDLFTDK